MSDLDDLSPLQKEHAVGEIAEAVRARAYADLAGLARLAADLHKENRELRDELNRFRDENAVNASTVADFRKLADFIRQTYQVSGGLGAVRDIYTALVNLERF